jgi:hypothetical protein
VSRLLAVTLVVAVAIVIAVALSLASLPTAASNTAATTLPKRISLAAMPLGKVTMCVHVGNKTVCADPATKNIVPVALMLASLIPNTCVEFNITLTDGTRINLCKVDPTRFVPSEVYVLLALTNDTSVSPEDYNIKGEVVLKIPMKDLVRYSDNDTIVFYADDMENITFNEVGLFYKFGFGTVMIARWVLPEPINVTAPNSIYVTVAFKGFARHATWPAIALKFVKIDDIHGIGSIIEIGHTNGRTYYKSCITTSFSCAHIDRAIARMLDTSTYEIVIPFMRYSPTNITCVRLVLTHCWYYSEGGRFIWDYIRYGSSYLVTTWSFSTPLVVPRIGSGLYGINIKIRAWYQS